MLTQEQLKKVLHYNPETGVFTWKVKPSPKVRIGAKAGKIDFRGYIGIKYKNIDYKAHRLAWLYVHGEFPKHEIDHINGNTLDNRISNLRDVSGAINSKNYPLPKTNKSGIMGVHRAHGKWVARICSNYKRIHLGTTDDFFEACCLRKSAERKYGFHENHGRSQLTGAEDVEVIESELIAKQQLEIENLKEKINDYKQACADARACLYRPEQWSMKCPDFPKVAMSGIVGARNALDGF